MSKQSNRFTKIDLDAIPPSQTLQALEIETATQFYNTITSKFSEKQESPDHEVDEKHANQDSRKKCHELMLKWINLLENATYMPVEHIQKEREYSIMWRTSFKN